VFRSSPAGVGAASAGEEAGGGALPSGVGLAFAGGPGLEGGEGAERALRPAVLVRKTGGCNKTPRGARTHAVWASLLQTLRQHGRETLAYRTSVLTAPARLPPLFPPPLWDTS
jgi:hypothetical protein